MGSRTGGQPQAQCKRPVQFPEHTNNQHQSKRDEGDDVKLPTSNPSSDQLVSLDEHLDAPPDTNVVAPKASGQSQ